MSEVMKIKPLYFKLRLVTTISLFYNEMKHSFTCVLILFIICTLLNWILCTVLNFFYCALLYCAEFGLAGRQGKNNKFDNPLDNS